MIQVHWSFLLRGPHNSLFGANQYHFRFPMILYSKQSLNVLTQTEKPHDISDNQYIIVEPSSLAFPSEPVKGKSRKRDGYTVPPLDQNQETAW